MTEPKLRFQEFKESWPIMRFGDLLQEHKEKTSDKETYPLYSLTLEDGVTPKSERYEREFLIKKEGDAYKIVPPNAFVYNPMNLRFGALAINHESFPVSVSGYYDVFTLGTEDTFGFWENYLVTPKMLHFYYSIANGSLVEKLRVHFSQFVDIKKPVPCLEEQQKIADLLSSVDEVISTLTEEVRLWEEKKKGVMQKLFSQEVRFKDENREDYPGWEIKTIGECCECLDNMRKPITKSDREAGIYPYYGSTNIQDYVAGYLFDEDLVLLAEDAGPFNDFWNKAIAQWATGKFWVNNHAHVLRPLEHRKFMFYSLEHKDIRRYINNPDRGKLNQEDMRGIEIGMPCLEEQQKIADCLSSIDEVITIKKQKLETWKNIKKGLLQQMFV